jgi:hypothetical protein
MADQHTCDLLEQIAKDYLRSTGESSLRKTITMIQEAITLTERAQEMFEIAEHILHICFLFRNAHEDPRMDPRVWDNADFSADGLEVVKQVFPEHEWPDSISYPNLVAFAGHIEESVDVARAVIMVVEARLLAKRAECIVRIVELYLDGLHTPSTEPYGWDQIASNMDDVVVGIVQEIFPKETWPPEKYGVPYPNLVALSKWTQRTRVVQSLLLGVFQTLDVPRLTGSGMEGEANL